MKEGDRMIYGDLEDWPKDRISISPALAAVLDWLKGASLENWALGTYPLPLWGDHALVIVKEAPLLPATEVKFERHQLHIDIHYCIAGEESIGFTRDRGNNIEVAVDYPMEDHTFYDEVENPHHLLLTPGMYAVFFPNDLHQPCCCSTSSASTVRKAVFKLPC
jgi:biofilm protein TabA